MQCGGFGYNQKTQKDRPRRSVWGVGGVEMAEKKERELVVPAGVVVLVVLGVWLYLRRR